MAALAKDILAGKQKLHDLVGMVAAWLFSLINRRRFAHDLVRELTSRIPLPWDAKMVAVARGIQITGILFCLSAGRELHQCQSFADLALTETKERLKHILKAAADDWIRLADFPPAASASGERG